MGYKVRYCRNITDIDDKILKRAQQLFGNELRYADVTTPMIENFHEDVNALNCLPPDYEPRVTDNIDQIIDFVAQLLDAGKAYQSNGDVYFIFENFLIMENYQNTNLKIFARVHVSMLMKEKKILLILHFGKLSRKGILAKSMGLWATRLAHRMFRPCSDSWGNKLIFMLVAWI